MNFLILLDGLSAMGKEMVFAAVMGMLAVVLSCSPFVPSNCQSGRHVGPLGRRKTVPSCVEDQHQYPLYRFRETSGWRLGHREVSKRAWCDLFSVNPVLILGCTALSSALEEIALAVHLDNGVWACDAFSITQPGRPAIGSGKW